MKGVPTSATVVEYYKKSGDFTDVALDVIKKEIVRNLQMLVDNIKEFDPNFPLNEEWTLINFFAHSFISLDCLDELSPLLFLASMLSTGV